MRQNIELKVRCSARELAAIRRRLAEPVGINVETLRQTDTYFRVAAGRLKLRRTEGTGSTPSAELIQYQRADYAGASLSSYRRVPIAPTAESELRSAMEEALGLLTVVRKVRSVALWRSTRIHLDVVDELGSFVELETVLSDDLSEDAGRAEFDEVVAWLGLGAMASIPGSYSDLMLPKRPDP